MHRVPSILPQTQVTVNRRIILTADSYIPTKEVDEAQTSHLARQSYTRLAAWLGALRHKTSHSAVQDYTHVPVAARELGLYCLWFDPYPFMAAVLAN